MENKEEIKITDEFDGVFRFTNCSDEDFVVLWNNKEYTFKANTRSPILIPNETLESIQEIRKKWAYKWAEREWYKGDEYKRMSNMGGGLPPTRDDKTLEPLIQKCLEPLPISKMQVKDLPKENLSLKGSKAVDEGGDLNRVFAEETKEENLVKLGKQPDSPID
ncbi:MAG TPA: hypothetical protein VLH94_00805 [Spirochaetia bacterium]|nr:hypothetical protein [Spirochaetia bacterium]